MDVQTRLETLLAVIDELGIPVRREPLGGDGGGLCKLRGQTVLFLDTSADTATRYERTVAAVANLSQLQDRFLPPEIREDLENSAKA